MPNSSSDTPSTCSIAPRVELRRAADGVQVDRAALLQRRQRLRAHAALADHRAHAVTPDDVGLVRLLADARRRAGRRHRPAVAVLQHHRAAVVEHRAVAGRPAARASSGTRAPRRGRCTSRPLISTTSPTFSARICSSVSGAVSTTSRPVRGKPAWSSIGIDRVRRIAVEPLLDRARRARRARRRGGGTPSSRRRPRRRSWPAGGSARRSCSRSATSSPPKPIGPTPSVLTVAMIVGFELRQPRVGIHVVERAEQLLLGVQRSRLRGRRRCRRRRRRGAALALRLPDRVQDALAHALEVAVGAARGAAARTGSEYWMFMFSQPPPLRISLTSISSRSHCSKWMTGVPGPEVVAGVLAGDRVDRVRPQLAAARRLGDRLADLLRASRSGWRRPAP